MKLDVSYGQSIHVVLHTERLVSAYIIQQDLSCVSANAQCEGAVEVERRDRGKSFEPDTRQERLMKYYEG